MNDVSSRPAVRRRKRGGRGPTTPDPIEIAMEAEAAGLEPRGLAREVLVQQARLIRWDVADRQAAFALKALTALAGIAAAAAVAVMAWGAGRASGVVIDGIGAPADLQARGLTATALATGLQDRLTEMDAETATPYQSAQLRDRPLSNVKVEIPSTGISIEDANQLMRLWLGRETHVTGELSYVPGGPDQGALALAVRVGSAPGRRFVSHDGDLEPLLAQAAEHVQSTLAPVRHAAWLEQHGRAAEAIAVVRAAAQRGSGAERARALGRLSSLLLVQQTPEARLAMDLEAGLATDAGASQIRLGRWEEAAVQFRTALRQGAPDTSSAWGRSQWKALGASGLGGVGGHHAAQVELGCFHYTASPCTPSALADAMEQADGAPNRDGSQAARTSTYVEGAVGLHELRAAERMLAAAVPDISARSEMHKAAAAAARLHAMTRLAAARGDWAKILPLAKAWDELAARWPGLRYDAPPVLYGALALAELGDVAGAEAAISSTRLSSYPSVRMRARIAEIAGGAARADHWFAQAVALAPSSPFAELEWGQALLDRGRAELAIEKFQAAARKGPKFADPLEFWGEALLAQGDAAGAATKFAQAEKLAPQWGRLHLDWGEALAKLGKTSEARAKWRAAAGMDLTADERVRVQALLAGRSA